MIAQWSDLEPHLGNTPIPPGLRAVVEIDLAARGPVRRHNMAQYVRVVRRPMKLEPPQPPGEWRHIAACKGQRMFYAAINAHQNRTSFADRVMEREALETCSTCPALEPCREWAMQDVDPATDHVAGGLTPKMRWSLRKGLSL